MYLVVRNKKTRHTVVLRSATIDVWELQFADELWMNDLKYLLQTQFSTSSQPQHITHKNNFGSVCQRQNWMKSLEGKKNSIGLIWLGCTIKERRSEGGYSNCRFEGSRWSNDGDCHYQQTSFVLKNVPFQWYHD